MTDRLRRLLATCFYVGFIPGAPGTYGSVVAAAAFYLAGMPTGVGGWLVLAALVALSAFALSRAVEVFGKSDPGPACLDEAAGTWLALLAVGASDWREVAAAFILFRIFDITKVRPINRFERIPGWLGILADDLAAGAFAAAVIWIYRAIAWAVTG